MILCVDGGSRGNPGPSAAGVVVLSPDGRVLHEFGTFLGLGTNNETEYRAILLALKEAQSRGARRVKLLSDSELVVKQLRGEYKIKEPRLQALRDMVREAQQGFFLVSFEHRPRSDPWIARADTIVNDTLDRAADAGERMPS